MKSFFFKTKFNVIFLFIPFVLIILLLISGGIGSVIFYNHFNKIYESEWKDKLLSRAQTFYIQIQQTLTRDSNVLPVSYVEDAEDVRPTVSIPSVVYDRNGNKIGYYGSERRDYISLNEMSTYFIYSLLASEDKRFFSHFGIDLRRSIGVLYYIFIKNDEKRGGGSSITQQLARYLMDRDDRTIERKIIEMLGALDLERKYSKKQILEMYCNYVCFGHGAYGVENASQTYFGKSAKDLTLAEAALLVGVIPAPERFSPFKSDEKSLQASKDRHKRVLYSIVETGFIPELDTKEKADKIHSEFWASYDLEKTKKIASFSIRFEKDVAYVGEQVRRELIERSEEFERLLLEGGGLSIYTTIDLKYERLAQQILKDELELYRQDIKQNYIKKFKENIMIWKKAIATDKKAKIEITDEDVQKALSEVQSGLILVDNETNEIIAFVGGDGFTTENQFMRTHQSKRQPGSAFKPILYYSVLDTRKVGMYDIFNGNSGIPITYGNGREWKVRNFGNANYGEIPLIEALYKSVNTVAAGLIRDLGVAPVRNNVKNILNLSDKEALERFPDGRLSISLGTSELTLLEMATMYTTFARMGKGSKPYLISKVYDHRGGLLIDNEKEIKEFTEKQILTRESVFILTRMMHKVFGPGGTAGGIRRLNFVPEEIDIKKFDDILSNFPTDKDGNNKNKEAILKFYDKDEEKGKYIMKDDTKTKDKDNIRYRISQLPRYNRDLKGWYIGKTGTTTANTDAWLCGSNSRYTLVVWVGNDNNVKLFRTGGDAAGIIWAKLMLEIEKSMSEIEIEAISKSFGSEGIGILKIGLDSPVIGYQSGYDLINIPVARQTGNLPVQGITPPGDIDYDAYFYKGTEPGNFDDYADYGAKNPENNEGEDIDPFGIIDGYYEEDVIDDGNGNIIDDIINGAITTETTDDEWTLIDTGTNDNTNNKPEEDDIDDILNELLPPDNNNNSNRNNNNDGYEVSIDDLLNK